MPEPGGDIWKEGFSQTLACFDRDEKNIQGETLAISSWLVDSAKISSENESRVTL